MTSASSTYVNIAAYKFVDFHDHVEKRPQFLAICKEFQLKGTILLTPEGINLFLAGLAAQIDGFLQWLRADPRFAELEVKYSYSEQQPFGRMLVKLKAEIITMKRPQIQPQLGRAPAVDAHTLKRWLDAGHDDTGRPVVMMDTRNAFEVDVGSFDDTIDYRIEKFSEFPDIVAQHQQELTDKTIVTFCTGGIRCEKAAIHMRNTGFEHVFQLDGGILKYFEEVGGAHYHGDCFVFDDRTALKPTLSPASAALSCTACGASVSAREQLSPLYAAGNACPHCAPAATPTVAIATHA